MTTPLDTVAIRDRIAFVRTFGEASGAGRISEVLDDADALLAEVERLRTEIAGADDERRQDAWERSERDA